MYNVFYKTSANTSILSMVKFVCNRKKQPRFLSPLRFSVILIVWSVEKVKFIRFVFRQ